MEAGFFLGKIRGDGGVYCGDRACPRASGWVGVRVRVSACARPDARDVCPCPRVLRARIARAEVTYLRVKD
jgi:hypothetical protein